MGIVYSIRICTKTLGTSESRRLFELSVKKDIIDENTDKILFYGSAGVGKTCIMNIVAGEDPPNVRCSTPIAPIRPVTMTMYEVQEMNGKWRKYTSRDKMLLYARISKSHCGLRREVVECLMSTETEIAMVPTSVVNSGNELGMLAGSDFAVPSAASQNLVKHDFLKVIHDVLDEMLQLIDECPVTKEPISCIRRVLVSDCGGQPQFHEIMPIFLRKPSTIVFVFKLSEELSSRPMIECYKDGKVLGTPYESDWTTEQLIQHGLQLLHSFQSGNSNTGDAPRIVMIGTHKDLEDRCKESREVKNQRLQKILLPTFKKEVLYYRAKSNDVLFPMNGKCPTKEEEAAAGAIRSGAFINHPRQIPLQWLGLEIFLDEITRRLQRGILSWNECFEVARRFHFDECTLEAALMYLNELSLILYCPNILPEVVFTNPQVLLDKMSELVNVHHGIKECSPDLAENEAWQEFYHHALVTLEFLSQKDFKKHYVPGIFQPEHLITICQRLSIFVPYSKDKFFVPYLLRMLNEEELAKHRNPIESLVAPLVFHFPDGPPRCGIFRALVSFLTSPENDYHFPGTWKLMMPASSVTPTCLYRNCIQFTVPGFKIPCAITLIDTLLHFEVHFNLSLNSHEEEVSKFCLGIKRAIFVGLRKATLNLNYADCTPSVALLCPCEKGELHLATIGDNCWICSLDKRVGAKLVSNQLSWLEDCMPEVSADYNQHDYVAEMQEARHLSSLFSKEVRELSSIGDNVKQALKKDLRYRSGESHAPIETSDVISNLKFYSENAIEYVKSEIDHIKSQHKDEVQELQEEMATLSKEKEQLLQQLNQEPKSKWESGLRGVDVHGETSLTVTNNAQQFIWEKFGLKLIIPSGVLPPGVDQCELLIKASFSGHYQLPKNYHLVSPFYWLHCEPYCKLAKPIALEIQHCALDQNLLNQRLSFVKALCTQKELPYSFEVISGGKFSESSSYGLIELSSFSGIGTGQRDSEERGYCASLFYLTSSIHDRQVHFTVTWNTEAHRNVIQRHYARLNATPGSEQEVEFESDAITLDIPERDGATRDSWKIVPLMRPRITKKQVDSFKKGRRIPHCSLQVLKLNNIRETKMYRVNLLGAKDNSFIVIRLSPENLSERISQDFGAYEEKHFTYLMTRLKDHAAEWKFIGCYLGFSQGQLKNIESNPTLLAKAPVSFLSELLTQWLQRGSATLESLKFALNQADLGVVAHEIVIP